MAGGGLVDPRELAGAELPQLEQRFRGGHCRPLADGAVLAAPAAGQGRDRRCRLHRAADPGGGLRAAADQARRNHRAERRRTRRRSTRSARRRDRAPITSWVWTSSGATYSPACSTARGYRSRWRSSRPRSRSAIGVTVGMIAAYYRGWVDTRAVPPDRRGAGVPDPAARESAWLPPARWAMDARAD